MIRSARNRRPATARGRVQAVRTLPTHGTHAVAQTVQHGGARGAKAKANDAVNHPKHYTSHPSGVECITVAEVFGFCIGNVIKYLWRAEEKGAPVQDLEKARWYLDREIARRKGKGGAR